MFNGSQFFYLLRKWKSEYEDCANEKAYIYIIILRYVMDYYFDSIAGYADNMFKIEGHFSVSEISHVLDSVGYYDYTIFEYAPGVTCVTLVDTL